MPRSCPAAPRVLSGGLGSPRRRSQSGRCDTSMMAITGVHAVLYTHEAEADRAWLTDVPGLKSVDAGGGWLIFALPPAELAVHPASSEGGEVELYLMCDDIESTMWELRDKGVAFDGSVADQPWGRVTKIVLPSGGRLGCTNRAMRARCLGEARARPRAIRSAIAMSPPRLLPSGIRDSAGAMSAGVAVD